MQNLWEYIFYFYFLNMSSHICLYFPVWLHNLPVNPSWQNHCACLWMKLETKEEENSIESWPAGLTRSVCVFQCMSWFYHLCLQGSDRLSTIIDHCFAHSPWVNICHPRMPEICFGSDRAMRGQSDFNCKQQRWKWIIKLEVRKRVLCIIMTTAKEHEII